MKVSVCMIVRNEEHSLRRALDSIPAGWEAVVLDTGSTDGTVQLARDLGAVVGHFNWVDDFAAARNASIALATGDYVLCLDADETLAADAEQAVRDYVDRHADLAGTVTITNLGNDEVHRHRMVRWFPNRPEFAFSGSVHEQVMCGDVPAPFDHIELELLHYGYLPEEYERKNKFRLYERLYQAKLQQTPDDGYMLYQMAKLLYSAGRLEEALFYFEACCRLREMGRLYFPPMLVLYGYCLKQLGRSKEAWSLLEPFQQDYADFPDLPFLMGLLAMDLGSFLQIEKQYQQALRAGECRKYSSHLGTGSFKAAYNLAVFYEITGQREQALRHYRDAARHQYRPAMDRLQKLGASL